MVLAVGTRIDPPESGTSTTLGMAGRDITFATELPDTDYHVSVTCETNPSGGMGEWWIEGKATTGFVLYNSGASGLTFTYAVTRY